MQDHMLFPDYHAQQTCRWSINMHADSHCHFIFIDHDARVHDPMVPCKCSGLAALSGKASLKKGANICPGRKFPEAKPPQEHSWEAWG